MNKEKDNVFKVTIPLITNEELKRFDYLLENDLDSIVQQISETVVRDKEIIFLKKVIEKLEKEVDFQKDQRKFWRDEYYQKMEQIQEIVEKSYNDIDYFNRDIRKDLENLLKGE